MQDESLVIVGDVTSNVLVLPDIHGRTFWKKPCEDIDEYDRVIFLGDYLDPYAFDGISVPDAIENFKEIIEYKKKHGDKVILLIGNHDCPYAFKEYYSLSSYHCRHSTIYHDEISKLFEKNKELFQICHIEGGVVFTHAGIESGWLENVVKYDGDNIFEMCDILNDLTKTKKGLNKLYYVTSERGGMSKYGSCIWTDVHDMMYDQHINSDRPIVQIKQVFGHTIQGHYNSQGKVVYGKAQEFDNCKMVDTANAYVLDTGKFELTLIK